MQADKVVEYLCPNPICNNIKLNHTLDDLYECPHCKEQWFRRTLDRFIARQNQLDLFSKQEN